MSKTQLCVNFWGMNGIKADLFLKYLDFLLSIKAGKKQFHSHSFKQCNEYPEVKRSSKIKCYHMQNRRLWHKMQQFYARQNITIQGRKDFKPVSTCLLWAQKTPNKNFQFFLIRSSVLCLCIHFLPPTNKSLKMFLRCPLIPKLSRQFIRA